MTTRVERSEPGPTTDRSPSDPCGTWTIDLADSTVCFAWRTLRLWTVTGRRQRWWTLHSHSLEILPGGAWRVMATLTTRRTPRLVELRLAADPRASGRDRLVLRGRSVPDGRAFATGRWPSSLDPTIRLELAIHARRVPIHPSTKRNEGEAIDGRVGAATRITQSAE
jgi:hypothetical protein